MSFVYKISDKNHVFVHIPKNGGKSLVKSLKHLEQSRPKIAHLTYLETENIVNGCDNYFCTIRNPWERMVSYYSYIKQNEPKEHGVYDFHEKISNGMKFDEFVDALIDDDRSIFRPQIDYMVNENGDICIKALRLENIQTDLNNYLKSNGYKGGIFVCLK